jgi:hypothetical protein
MKLTTAQRKALQSYADNYEAPDYADYADRAGAALGWRNRERVITALIRKGLLTKNQKMTEAGRIALMTEGTWVKTAFGIGQITGYMPFPTESEDDDEDMRAGTEIMFSIDFPLERTERLMKPVNLLFASKDDIALTIARVAMGHARKR